MNCGNQLFIERHFNNYKNFDYSSFYLVYFYYLKNQLYKVKYAFVIKHDKVIKNIKTKVE